ncbi:U2 small nuclear ribonucleoprotein auxiliary factor 35 kDa subunit-related protein 2-like [Anneissia japonica]|uniref:U2 small nuclear ribonucleoprotein auxiliary factor 35 kDa subunit-related protein 2-like n=1 Tax=Anneissia japonica TaxID=1529436 RepID=UPI0014257E7C|nr:U2 small nuclear ribonucleoprotein auxiliary factor 35 kDa subunit-related protein 2-like [Anneissia japonica]
MAAPLQKLSHKQYKALLKKEKRKKKRQEAAKLRHIEQNDTDSIPHISEGEDDEQETRTEEIEREKAHQAWLERERVAQILFERKKQQEEEWKKQQEEAERKIEEELEKQKNMEKEFLNSKNKKTSKEKLLEDALHVLSDEDDQGVENTDAPTHNPEAPRYIERKPEECKFYLKTGVCRFGNRCSRNHEYPLISATLLIKGMFYCYAMEQSYRDEYDADIGLEFDEAETQDAFCEFYDDALAEFKKAGKVIQFKVCSNWEPHLRGNVYVEFETEAGCSNAFSMFNGRSNDAPTHNPEAPRYIERKPEECKFYLKTGVCRFGNRCSRNHEYPLISATLLIKGMFYCYAMEQSYRDEYDADIGLEFDEAETQDAFCEFYDDALAEFKKAGKVIQFKVCSNWEPHLRGNVYVEFETEAGCSNAFSMFNGRFYAGRQLSCEYSPVTNWNAAICGLYHRKKCPKGKNCNFLHVFRNPTNEFPEADEINSQMWSSRRGGWPSERSRLDTPMQSERRFRDHSRWRSRDESWEKHRRHRSRSRERHRTRSRSRERHRSRERRRSRSRERRRSRSRERHRSRRKRSRERYSHRKENRERRKSNSRSRSRSYSRERSRSRSMDRDWDRDKHHSRSKSQERDGEQKERSRNQKERCGDSEGVRSRSGSREKSYNSRGREVRDGESSTKECKESQVEILCRDQEKHDVLDNNGRKDRKKRKKSKHKKHKKNKKTDKTLETDNASSDGGSVENCENEVHEVINGNNCDSEQL